MLFCVIIPIRLRLCVCVTILEHTHIHSCTANSQLSILVERLFRACVRRMWPRSRWTLIVCLLRGTCVQKLLDFPPWKMCSRIDYSFRHTTRQHTSIVCVCVQVNSKYIFLAVRKGHRQRGVKASNRARERESVCVCTERTQACQCMCVHFLVK